MPPSDQDEPPDVIERRGVETVDVPALEGSSDTHSSQVRGAREGAGSDHDGERPSSPVLDPGRPHGSSPAEPKLSSPRADRIGRYTVLGTVGEGGMGMVLRAYDDTLDRMVALKLLRKNFVKQRQRRLLREAQALAQLSHPNVVQVYEIGVFEGLMFIAMELVSGRTLGDWQRDPRRWSEVLGAYLQAGRGLAAAHHQGLVHRDFKPENCIIGDDGRVRVLDFGLARGRKPSAEESRERTPNPSLPELDDSGERRLTRSGAVIGTLRYLPLQQLEGELADTKSDQYSFCVSLYEGLYGFRPFSDATFSELTHALRREELLPVPRTAAVPKRLRRILLRGLAKFPEDRWPSMDVLLGELERAARPHRRWMIAWGAALGLAVGAGSWSLARSQEDPCQSLRADFQDIWGPVERGTVRATFTGSGHPEASLLFEHVHGQLTAYTGAWVEMAEQSCRATFVDHRQSEALFDRRMLCLDRRHSRLRATIDSLAEATTAQQVVDRTILPFKLPSLAPCADVDALMARQPPPDDPAVREQVASLRQRIDHANTLREAGELSRGVALAKTIVTEARALDHAPVLAEALECLGHVQSGGASGREARVTLDEAIEVAARARADEVSARAWALLLFALMREGKLDEGIAVGRAAQAAADRVGDEVARGWTLNNLGVLHGERGDYQRSHDYLRQALEVKRQNLGEGHVDVGIAWFNLGSVRLEHGRSDEAMVAYERARAIFEATVGGSHPYVAFVVTGQGQIAHQVRGRPAEAAQFHRRALAIRRAATGPEHIHVARSLRNLAEAELDLGQLDPAWSHLQRALDIIERLNGPDDLEVAHTLVVLAELELSRQHPGRARARAQRALAIVDAHQVTPAQRARVLFVLARSLWSEIDERPRARTLAEQATLLYASTPHEDRIHRERLDAWLREHAL